ncbi:uncharacterized protein BDCG_17210 [Blastomyces dermatitidis ER-3]|uniref:Uncharacterized protein n=2 Tax=Ajellomyces dermatitidis TaxID=5039 RepID=A0A0J9EKC6_AJEDA|nr:uncharacterized protein BDCG_17210 [Blastomyces dermatitidis ER-3]KMW66848.1 hypothetical protein BDDG_11748 [Blastomyces dermatitidis ATCC 18188]OAT01695.1 hypothetical protein BDCG_17210 [Blastomyces dermatitidis ER-3]
MVFSIYMTLNRALELCQSFNLDIHPSDVSDRGLRKQHLSVRKNNPLSPTMKFITLCLAILPAVFALPAEQQDCACPKVSCPKATWAEECKCLNQARMQCFFDCGGPYPQLRSCEGPREW